MTHVWNLRRWALLFPMAAVVLLSGCFVALDGDCVYYRQDGALTYRCSSQPPRRTHYCRLNMDCLENETCDKGLCELRSKPPVRCRVDVDCARGQICEFGQCNDGCRRHSHCARGQICRSRICTTPCVRQRDCPSGVCWDGFCKKEACRDDGDCQKGRICAQPGERCVPGCRRASDCASGQMCQKQRCVKASDPCAEDEDCAPGKICKQSFCQEGCRSTRDCPRGKTCQASGICGG